MENKREYERFVCLVEVRYQGIDGKESGYCFSKDISQSGMCLPLDRPLPVDRKLIIEVDLPDGGGKFKAESTVRWCSKGSSHWESLYCAGIRFEKIDPGLAEKLVSFARSHQYNKSEFEHNLENHRIKVIENEDGLF
ncbi:MAG: PilZ domain-containing protein [Candidatus Omnitrophota bacterium]